MRRALAGLWILGLTSPCWAPTRLYFPTTEVSDVNPGFDAGWEDSTEGERRKLRDVKGADAITVGQVVDILEDQTSWQELDRQFVSTQMAAGNVFTSGAGNTSAKMQVMVREYAGTDDVDKCIVGARIMSEDGGTLRATLFTVINKGPILEFINNATHRNKTCLDGDFVGESYTTVAGDRLVVEVGYQTDGLETTPQASAKWGDNATDCAENETATADCAGWIEFSNTITFQGPVAAGVRRRVVVLD